jgi:hypothetical protein
MVVKVPLYSNMPFQLCPGKEFMVKEGMNCSLHTFAGENGLREMEPAPLRQNYDSHKLRVRKIFIYLNNTRRCTSYRGTRKWDKKGNSLPKP